MTQEEINEVIRKHKLWREDKEGGEKANLISVDLSGHDLRDVDLQQAVLRDSNLECTDLRGANLQWANLSHTRLGGARLVFSKLDYANLEGANLEGASLWGADLREANLEEANLKGANLKGANLKGANLEEANLEEVDLRYAPNFSGTKGNPPVYQASCGFGSRNSTLTLLALGAEKDWQFFTGCFKGNKEKLVAAVKERYTGIDRKKYMNAINYLLTTARLNKKDKHNEQDT